MTEDLTSPTLLPPTPKCWGYKSMIPHLAAKTYIKKKTFKGITGYRKGAFRCGDRERFLEQSLKVICQQIQN